MDWSGSRLIVYLTIFCTLILSNRVVIVYISYLFLPIFLRRELNHLCKKYLFTFPTLFIILFLQIQSIWKIFVNWWKGLKCLYQNNTYSVCTTSVLFCMCYINLKVYTFKYKSIIFVYKLKNGLHHWFPFTLKLDDFELILVVINIDKIENIATISTYYKCKSTLLL